MVYRYRDAKRVRNWKFNNIVKRAKERNTLPPQVQMPYINTGLMVNELVNLDYEATNNVIRVHEKPGARKDRYSSVSYNYYIAQQIERSMVKKYAKTKKIEINFRAPNMRRGLYGR